MKKLFVLIFSLFSITTFAGEKIDKKLDVLAQGEIEIHNNRGEITLKGWDKNQVSVKGELDDLTEKFVFTSEKGKTLIKVILSETNVHARSGDGSNLKIFVPYELAVQFGGVATDLDLSQLRAGVDINSVSGDVELNKVDGRVYINSVSGNIKLNGLKGQLEISTVSGDVDAKVSSKQLSISGVSSDIEVKTGEFEMAKLATVSGDSKLYGQLQSDGEIRLSSVSGNGYFYVDGELNAKVVLDTGPGGDVVNQLSDDKPTSSFIGSEKLKFTAGNGNGVIRMSTVSGNIGLKKASKRK